MYTASYRNRVYRLPLVWPARPTPPLLFTMLRLILKLITWRGDKGLLATLKLPLMKQYDRTVTISISQLPINTISSEGIKQFS